MLEGLLEETFLLVEVQETWDLADTMPESNPGGSLPSEVGPILRQGPQSGSVVEGFRPLWPDAMEAKTKTRPRLLEQH